MENRTYYTEQMLQDEQFIQFPKWLMQDSEFSKMSNDAKVLYCMLKYRFKLSAKNHWIDKEGKVFVVCKRESMATMLNVSEKTARKIFKELVDAKLVDQKHNGLNKPNYIYLLMPKFGTTPDITFEEDEWVDKDLINEDSGENKLENKQESRTGKNYRSGPVKITGQDRKILPPNNNKSSNNKSSKDILNNNIDNTYNSSNVVVNDETITKLIESVIYNSTEFLRYQESGNIDPVIKATNKLIDNIKKQSKKKKTKIAEFSQEQILQLLKASLTVVEDETNSFTKPDAYIVSRLNEQLN